MADLVDNLWFGPQPAVEAAVAELGNVKLRIIGGVAYATVRAETLLPVPAGLASLEPELARALMGKWVGDPSAVPARIERRQFILGLALEGFITFDEAEAFGTVGTIPAAILGAINSLPPPMDFIGRTTFREMNYVERGSALLGPLAAAILNMDDQAVDAAFIRWVAL